jgi:DNA-binding CsgD family transcriptional regulator
MGSGGTPFLGRERELALLEAALQRAQGGVGNVAMLVGEAGIGKTRTAQEVEALADATGFRVAGTACYESEWSPPYGPWLAVVGDLLRGRGQQFLRAQPEVRLTVLAELLPELLEGHPELPRAPRLSPEEARYRATDALARLVLALADQPLLVVLDDLHWADGASLELLVYLGRLLARGRLLVVGTYRDAEVGLDHPLAGCLAELDREHACLRVPLAPLSHDDATALVERLAGRPVATLLAEAVLRETQGHPFFVEELVRHLLEEGADMSASVPLGIPASVRQAIGARLTRLAAATRQTLGVACAFTGPFDFAVLREMTGLPEEELLSCLDEALHARMLQAAGGERYQFAHALVRRTLYDELSPSRRTRLHRRIAQAVERVHVGRELEYASELAAQYHASASLPGAAHGVGYALAAAEQASAAHGQEQAVSFLRLASDLAADSDVVLRAEIAWRLALAEAEAVLVEAAERSALEAMSLLAQTGAPPERIAEFATAAGRRLQDAGSAREVVLALAAQGLAALGERRDLPWARLRLLDRPVERIDAGSLSAGRWLGFDREAVAIARTGGDENDFASTLELMDWRTREETDALLTMVRRWSEPTAKIHGLSVVARSLLFQHGAFRQSAEVCEELLAASESFGSLPGQAYALAHLADAQTARGELALAQSSLEQARELVHGLGPGHRLHFSLPTVEAKLAEYNGADPAAIAASLSAAVSHPRFAPWMTSVHLSMIARATARAGDSAEASRLLAMLTSILERMEPTTLNQNCAVACVGATAWELEDAEHAAIYRRLALELIAAGVGDYPSTSSELTVARMASLLGNLDEAADYFDRARIALEVSGQSPLRAIVDHDEALHRLRNRLPRAAPLLAAARGRFETLGMAEWAERADRLASRLGEGYPDGLTGREVEVLRLLADGRTNAEIAARLVISVHTVERHLANVYRKIGARNRAEAAGYMHAVRL